MYCGAVYQFLQIIDSWRENVPLLLCFWVYWASSFSSSVMAALLYNYLLALREEPFTEGTWVLFCFDSTMENEVCEPLLEQKTGQIGTQRKNNCLFVFNKIKFSIRRISLFLLERVTLWVAHLFPVLSFLLPPHTDLHYKYWNACMSI